MAATSAGILPYRIDGGSVLVFVAHMGGPFWARKDAGAWSLVKGEYDPDAESAEEAARREFREETGVDCPSGTLVDLGSVTQRAGKVVTAFGVEAPPNLAYVASGDVTMTWPPRSGRTITFPEVDRAEWMTVDEARPRLVAAQTGFLDALLAHLGRA